MVGAIAGIAGNDERENWAAMGEATDDEAP